jgi:hypothetical protein
LTRLPGRAGRHDHRPARRLLCAATLLDGVALAFLCGHDGTPIWQTARVVSVAIATVVVIKMPSGLQARPAAVVSVTVGLLTSTRTTARWCRAVVVPYRSGAALVLLHGGGSTRSSALDHATVLARHGYGCWRATPACMGAARARRDVRSVDPGIAALIVTSYDDE